MKNIFFIIAVMFAFSTAEAQGKKQKQYRSAESGRYVTKQKAEKSPATTYSTPRKARSKKAPK